MSMGKILSELVDGSFNFYRTALKMNYHDSASSDELAKILLAFNLGNKIINQKDFPRSKRLKVRNDFKRQLERKKLLLISTDFAYSDYFGSVRVVKDLSDVFKNEINSKNGFSYFEKYDLIIANSFYDAVLPETQISDYFLNGGGGLKYDDFSDEEKMMIAQSLDDIDMKKIDEIMSNGLTERIKNEITKLKEGSSNRNILTFLLEFATKIYDLDKANLPKKALDYYLSPRGILIDRNVHEDIKYPCDLKLLHQENNLRILKKKIEAKRVYL